MKQDTVLTFMCVRLHRARSPNYRFKYSLYTQTSPLSKQSYSLELFVSLKPHPLVAAFFYKKCTFLVKKSKQSVILILPAITR
ncbi:hypothetical protein ALT1000_180055 [Alteromonas macleodii]